MEPNLTAIIALTIWQQWPGATLFIGTRAGQSNAVAVDTLGATLAQNHVAGVGAAWTAPAAFTVLLGFTTQGWGRSIRTGGGINIGFGTARAVATDGGALAATPAAHAIILTNTFIGRDLGTVFAGGCSEARDHWAAIIWGTFLIGTFAAATPAADAVVVAGALGWGRGRAVFTCLNWCAVSGLVSVAFIGGTRFGIVRTFDHGPTALTVSLTFTIAGTGDGDPVIAQHVGDAQGRPTGVGGTGNGWIDRFTVFYTTEA